MNYNINRVNLFGGVSNDINEIKEDMVTFSIFQTEKYKKGEEEIKKTHFFKVVAFGNLAKKAKTLSKNDFIAIEGSLKTNTFKDKEGNEKTEMYIELSNFDGKINTFLKPETKEED
tara:strand:- start:8285 stop:8632 length:348 start_codon:yes stop_codon:yes gene_type:complete